MTGPPDSVLGMDKRIILERFRTGMPTRFEVAEQTGVISGVVVDVQRKAGRLQSAGFATDSREKPVLEDLRVMRTTLILSTMALAGIASAQFIYAPVRSIKDQGITVRGWGSGTISETDELAYEGSYSIRVSTRNFFQGGIMAFANPVDLAGAYGNKNNLLRILIRVADSNLTLGGPSGGGPVGGGGKTGGPDAEKRSLDPHDLGRKEERGLRPRFDKRFR
jgi:hypothetical protein